MDTINLGTKNLPALLYLNKAGAFGNDGPDARNVLHYILNGLGSVAYGIGDYLAVGDVAKAGAYQNGARKLERTAEKTGNPFIGADVAAEAYKTMGNAKRKSIIANTIGNLLRSGSKYFQAAKYYDELDRFPDQNNYAIIQGKNRLRDTMLNAEDKNRMTGVNTGLGGLGGLGGLRF